MLSLNQLLTLREVLSSGSFAIAAERLNYTPSAVSQQMSSLERATGLTLFERSAHSVRPTEQARQLSDRSSDLLAMLGGLERDVAALARGEAGIVRIGSFPTASAHLLPPALAAVRTERPGIEITVDEGELDVLMPRLLDGELDLAVAYRYTGAPRAWPARLVARIVVSEPVRLLVPSGHPKAHATQARLTMFSSERWVAPMAGSPGADNLDRLAGEAGFVPRISFRSSDYSVVRGLVAAGLGVALVPRLALVGADTAGVVALRLAGRQPHREIVTLHRPGMASPLVTAAAAAVAQAGQRLR